MREENINDIDDLLEEVEYVNRCPGHPADDVVEIACELKYLVKKFGTELLEYPELVMDMMKGEIDYD